MVINPKTGEKIEVSSYINQAVADLIGYMAIYENGYRSVFRNYSDIDAGTVENPIVAIEQVGKLKTPSFLVRRASDGETETFSADDADGIDKWLS